MATTEYTSCDPLYLAKCAHTCIKSALEWAGRGLEILSIFFHPFLFTLAGIRRHLLRLAPTLRYIHLVQPSGTLSVKSIHYTMKTTVKTFLIRDTLLNQTKSVVQIEDRLCVIHVDHRLSEMHISYNRAIRNVRY